MKHKAGYVKLKHLKELIEKYPDAVLAYEVDQNKYGYSHKLVAEMHDELVEMHPDCRGRGKPNYRHLVMLR